MLKRTDHNNPIRQNLMSRPDFLANIRSKQKQYHEHSKRKIHITYIKLRNGQTNSLLPIGISILRTYTYTSTIPQQQRLKTIYTHLRIIITSFTASSASCTRLQFQIQYCSNRAIFKTIRPVLPYTSFTSIT